MADTLERWCSKCHATAHRMQGKWWCLNCRMYVKVIKPKGK